MATTVFGKSFNIPQEFKESNRFATSTYENVTFVNEKDESFMIHVSSKTDFPFESPYIDLTIEKNINSFDGKMLYYEPAGTKRFVYMDNEGLLVYIEPDFYPYDEILDIIVC